MSHPISSVLLYVKDVATVSEFYEQHFGFRPEPGGTPGWRVLAGPGSCTLSLHRAAKGQKSGAAMKIVFAVRDIGEFVKKKNLAGLKFGSIHEADGYSFANAKDPAGNSISVSSRAFRRPSAL